MIDSKAWKWEIVDKDDVYWTSPAPEIYFLCEKWKQKGYKKFLDIGCGFGRNSIYMAKNGYNVYGFDLSEHSVEMTMQKAKNQGVELKDFCVADMLNLPYQDNSFDCMLAMNVISHTDKQGFNKVLDEIKRVLKPGGEVYFTVGSKESYWFNNPVCIPVDDCTKIRVEDGPENGIPHFYINDEDCFKLFNDFTIVEIKNVRELTQYGNFSPHYHIWLKK
ncbi:MAG: class I SAM-dependent methyltransferase [Clostridia bacterium]|nr:class I SAM-dependent methyltransferase [Clostridia bacterium]